MADQKHKWRPSRYNIFAKIPGSDKIAGVNLYKGICGEYTPPEMYLLSEVENLPSDHPIMERFINRGLITDHDERAALIAGGRLSARTSDKVCITICPTIGCNFDCPYCFEDHRPGRMSDKVQDDVVTLTEKMLDATNAETLTVIWFGGEPLLMPDIIEALSARLMALANEKNVSYTAEIITNGYLLTHDIVDMLERVKIDQMQITLDGMGATHDATRHLAGGGGTFDRITSNLRELHIPFPGKVRQNVHNGNISESDQLREFLNDIARQSGNTIMPYRYSVDGNEASDNRGSDVSLLCDEDMFTTGLEYDVNWFRAGNSSFCCATQLNNISIDNKGNIIKCWENVDKPYLSFGTADRWDPKDPIRTASDPDNLIRFMNCAIPLADDECMDCIWLPSCAGGCPVKRLEGRRRCVTYKDNPEAFVLALYEKMRKAGDRS